MTTKTKTTKANTTARNAKKATKAQSAKPATKNATVAKRAAKESKQGEPASKKLSQIEAAIIILGKSKKAMNCKAMVEAMQVAGLWASPGGATPEATLYASILREINTKGKDARFKKTERGHFTLAGK